MANRIILSEEEEYGDIVESIFKYSDNLALYKATIKRNMKWGSVYKWSDTNGWLHLVGTEFFDKEKTIQDLMRVADIFHHEMRR